MARTDERFRTAYNAMLAVCSNLTLDAKLPSELSLADRLDVSRTVVRSALQRLDAEGIIEWNGRDKKLLRKPRKSDQLDVKIEHVSEDELAGRFLDWILRSDAPSGTPLNVTYMARKFDVSAHALQEFSPLSAGLDWCRFS